MSLTRTKYSQEEKIQMVNEFAKSGLTKWSFVLQHPEYKRSTLFNWLQKYFPNNDAGTAKGAESSLVTEKSKDSISKFKMVLETAKMTEVEVGAYCRSNGIYASDLNTWKLNCMNANDRNTESLEKELIRLRAEVKLLKEKDSQHSAELKKNEKELNRMKDALAEYAVKEAFLKKAQAFFGKKEEDQ